MYIPFSKQFGECTKNGTAFRIRCHWCGREMIVCQKYKTN